MKNLFLLMVGAVLVTGVTAYSSPQAQELSNNLNKETFYDLQLRRSGDLVYEQLINNAAYGGFNSY